MGSRVIQNFWTSDPAASGQTGKGDCQKPSLPQPRLQVLLRTENRELRTIFYQFAQLTAALPALRLILAAADKVNAASIEFQTRNGTAAGVQTFRHHLPQRGSLTRCET